MKECIVCGKPFTPVRTSQKYCSPVCRKYSGRHDGIVTYAEAEEGAEAIRSFTCVKCGKVIRVTSPDDRRTKFCTRRCEKLYWKHSRKVSPKLVCREFDCRECGKHITVEDAKDLRRIFCSPDCSRKWFARKRSQMTAKAREASREREKGEREGP